MKEIPLTRGKVALVDDADYEWLSQWKWHAMKSYRDVFYAGRSEYVGGKNPKVFLMHRVILDAGQGMYVDHISGDGLDNRRVNLRLATGSQNRQNARGWRDGSSSKFKGVMRVEDQWLAQIYSAGKRHHLGRFKTEANAATAYNLAALEHFGEFARLNG